MAAFLTFVGIALAWAFTAWWSKKSNNKPINQMDYIPTEPSQTPETAPVASTQPEVAPEAVQAPVDTLLPWNTIQSLSHANWHNVRVLCDLEGLTREMKEELCATVWGESEFNTHARLENKDKTGKVWSVDNGICQWNSYWHATEITPQEAIYNPEKAVRLMCKYFLKGQADQWVAHKTGAYKTHLGKML